MFERYEDWVLSAGTRPTVVLFLTLFVMLSILGLLGYRRAARSLRAWFWFSLANAGAWAYLYWASNLSPENNDHARFILIHYTVITGSWFCVALALRILGHEERPRRTP